MEILLFVLWYFQSIEWIMQILRVLVFPGIINNDLSRSNNDLFMSQVVECFDLPGSMDIVLSARSTRNVRSPARLPTSMPIVAYPLEMTTKSSQFHGFRRYVYLFRMKPLATLLMVISQVYMAKKTYLKQTN